MTIRKLLVVCLLLLVCGGAYAAPTLLAHTITQYPTVSSPINTTGATLIVINISGQAPVSPSDNMGNTYTALTGHGSNGVQQLFYVSSPIVSASHTFSVVTTNWGTLTVQAFSGTRTTTPFDLQNGSSGGTSATGCTTNPITPSVAGELFIAALEKETGSISDVYTADSSFIITDQVGNGGPSYGGAMAYKVTNATESVFFGASATGRVGCGIASFLPTPGPGTVITAIAPVVSGTYCGIIADGGGCLLSASVTAGDTYVLITGHGGGDTCSTSQAYTSSRASVFTRRAAAENVSGAQSNTCISSAPITSSGSDTIVVTGLGSNVPCNLYVYVVHATTVVFGTGGGSTADGVGSINTGSLSGTQASRLMAWCGASDSLANPFTASTPVAGPTVAFDGLNPQGAAMYQVNLATGSYSCTFTKGAGGNRWSSAIVMMTYNPAAGGTSSASIF